MKLLRLNQQRSFLLDFFRYREVYEPVMGLKRSGSWPMVRKEHLLKQPDCQVCKIKKNLEVHHLVPFHVNMNLELEPTNLITLCRPHHFLFGHLCDWSYYNTQCTIDCLNFYNRV